MKTDLICVGPDDLDATWPLVSDMMALAYEKTDHVMPDVLEWLKAGRGLLWIAAQEGRIVGALTSSLEPRLSGLACRLVAYSGAGVEHWLNHLTAIEDYARGAGCVKMCLDGRRGWERVLPDYAIAAISLEKGL